MAKVEIYTTAVCPFCINAKRLLTQKNVTFVEIRVDQDVAKREEMLVRAQGRRTVPQIFINDQPVGGSDDLYALETAGKLDSLLRS